MKNLRIAIIGAGASGIMSVVKLREAGITDVAVFEKASSLGGTWRDNQYPGLICDVPSHAYRLSFAPNPDWSMVCSPGSEILEYLKRTASEFDVEKYIQYDSEVVNAVYNNDGKWNITTTQGPQGEFDAVITAAGVLHHPAFPDIKDLDTFAGECFHTLHWPDDIDLTDKRVGIIGVGSSGAQVISAVVDQVSDITVFARTPQWIKQFENIPYTEEEKERYRTDPVKLKYDYDNLCHKANSEFAAAVVGENIVAYEEIAKDCKDYLATVKDPELRAKLTPDYKVGCKRLVISADFYEAIQKPNAHYIDDGIDYVDATGVVTKDGTHHDLDILVLATGFDAHKSLRPMQVTGRDGITLEKAWAESNQGYKTVTAPGFPNWFMIGGPTSPIGNFSFMLTAETQHAYIVQLLEKLQNGEAKTIEPKTEATIRFNNEVRERLPKTIWMSGCGSWYKDKTGNAAVWPWTWDVFAEALKEPVWEDFDISA